jgi:hypothetical protein
MLTLRDDLPNENLYEADARPLVPAGSPRPPAAKASHPKPKPKPSQPTAPKHLFEGVELTNLGGRIAAVLGELKRLDVDQYPNACAALLGRP